MAVLIGKTNLAVASAPVGGVLIGKTNLAIASAPVGGAMIAKTNLTVASTSDAVEIPPAQTNRRRLSVVC